MRLRKPTTIIEVGSGYSTAVALDTRDEALPDLRITCIEPYPERLLRLLRPGDHEHLVLRREAVQDTPMEVFDALEPDDILFIDSTHVSKAGSDVNWLVFEVLPRLRPGVLVHVHDIFWPFEYPTEWLDEGRDWNESYVLRAFLTLNENFAVRLFLNYVWHTMPDVAARFPGEWTPSGLWLERIRRTPANWRVARANWRVARVNWPLAAVSWPVVTTPGAKSTAPRANSAASGAKSVSWVGGWRQSSSRMTLRSLGRRSAIGRSAPRWVGS